MAQRRMFSKEITNSSNFLMMSQSAQNLYFHIGMNADDDGFCEIFTIMRMTESKPDDLRALHERNLIYVVDNKVAIVKNWHENNYIQNDRYTPSKYLTDQKFIELYKMVMSEKTLALDRYKGLDTKCIQNASSGKVRLGKVRKRKELLSSNDDPREYIKTLLESDTRHIHIIGLYFSNKGIEFPNTEACRSAIKRELRPAQALVGHKDEIIIGIMKYLAETADYKWTLETVGKFIDEPKIIKYIKENYGIS